MTSLGRLAFPRLFGVGGPFLLNLVAMLPFLLNRGE